MGEPRPLADVAFSRNVLDKDGEWPRPRGSVSQSQAPTPLGGATSKSEAT